MGVERSRFPFGDRCGWVEYRVLGLVLSLTRQITALIHPEALARPSERARHEAFIARQLLASLAIMAVAPLFLACYGAPAPWHAMVFAWGIVPLCAVVLVSRSGDLVLAQGLSIASFIGVATTLAIGGGDAWQTALAWLVLAPLEGVFSQNYRLVFTGSALAITSLLGLACAAAMGWFDVGFSVSYAVLLIAPAIVYAALLAAAILRQQRDHRLTVATLNTRQNALYETLGDLVIHHDATGSVEQVGTNCESLFGLQARALIGRGLFEHIHVADRPAFLKCLAEATRSPTTVCAMLRLRAGMITANGPTFRWIELRAHACSTSKLQDGSSTPAVLSILRDVTDAKAQAEELNAARTALEDHGVWKDQFLANVSHELRTPLNAIIGFAEMLSNPQLAPQLPERRREYASIIQQSGQHLLSVVNSILDMSKIQSGTFDIAPEAFDMAPLIDLCCDMVKLKAQENKIELVRAYPHTLEEIVGDKRACKQILINLLSNAVKFTPARGRVTVDVQPDGNYFSISVSDSGIGIAAPDLARLGDPFFQAGASYDRHYEGTGLGLSVVRGLVGLHGGTMSIESELGKGTRVSVRLPLDCRQIAATKNKSAKIETIPRRSRVEDVKNFNQEMTVKKIA
jgi:two-component system, cell cycle sensor histidine kinase DivJ